MPDIAEGAAGAADDNGRCAHCGLPLPTPWLWSRPARRAAPEFCCLGCRIAAAVAGSNDDEGASHWMLAKIGLAIFCTMNVMVFTMVLWTYDVYDSMPSAAPPPLAPALEELFRFTCLVSALPVLLLLGPPLAESAWRQLRCGTPGVDFLLLAGVVSAFTYSAWAVLAGHSQIYFEVGCVVLVAVTLGRWFEATVRLSSGRALEHLAHLLPQRARRLRDERLEIIDASQLRPGDVYQVLAGERLPADGVLLRGEASLDEQFLTGESTPSLKRRGDRLFGGSLNLDGALEIRATAGAAQGALASIVAAVRHAQLAGGHYQRLADRVARWFGLIVAVVAVGTLLLRGWAESPAAGLLSALAVLLIACPCALGVATPLAIWCAIQRAAERQIVFRSGEALERLAGVDMVRFDKTGTLTTGRPRVECLAVRGALAEPILLAVAHASSHPLARALVEHLDDRPVAPEQFELLASRTIPGRGLEATLSHRGCTFGATLGEPDWLIACGAACPAALRDVARAAEREGAPRMALACQGRIQAVATFSEQLRCGAPEAIRWLQQQGYDPAVLSGDRAARASVVGRALQIAVVDGQSPTDKAESLAALARRGHRVAMVGDGINDAPALATAYVGVSLADGADLARETAGVCLLGDDLRRLPEALVLARRTVRVVRQNLFWALVYNVVGIGFAVAGWMNPVVAAAAMVVSSALVLANSLRLRGDDSTPRRTARADDVENPRDDEAPTGTTPLDIGAELDDVDHPVEAHA